MQKVIKKPSVGHGQLYTKLTDALKGVLRRLAAIIITA